MVVATVCCRALIVRTPRPRCENASLRARCGMGAKATGVMVKRVTPTCAASGALRRADPSRT
jgi:hypothetical protein